MTAMAPPASPLSIGGIFQVTFSLALVVALIFAVSWLLRRLKAVPGRGSGEIGIVDEFAVTPRDRIVLLRVGDAQVLIGIGAGGIVGLTPLATPLTVHRAQAPPRFADRLRELLGRAAGPA